MRLKCYILSISELTLAAADAADDDAVANQFDVTVPHPERLLLVILGDEVSKTFLKQTRTRNMGQSPT